MHGRAKGTADHYWPWAVFFKILKFRQGSGPERDDVLYDRGVNFPSIRGGQGLSKGRQGLGERGEVAGGLEQGSWGLGRVSKGVGGWGLERAEGLRSGGGAGPSRDVRTDVRTFARTFVRMDGRKIHPSVL